MFALPSSIIVTMIRIMRIEEWCSTKFSRGTELNRLINLVFLVVLLLLSIVNVHAAIGLPDNTARIGFSLGAARLQISDPVGDTQPVIAAQPLKLMYSEWLSGGYRVWLESYYQEASFAADETHIGQYFQQGGMHLSIQRNFNIAKYVKPWLGLGMDVSLGRYTQRHTKDDEDYLLELHADRLQPTAGALLYLVNEWQVSKEWSVGGTLLQRFSINNAVTESSFSIFFLTRY